MTIVIRIDYQEKDPQAIKEALAMDLEKYGSGIRVVEVREDELEQMSIYENRIDRC